MILDDILASKRREVQAVRGQVAVETLRRNPLYDEPRRAFAERLRNSAGRRVVAEIKRMSPSRGVIRDAFDPVEHARDYEAAGAACISVLTDGPYFGGSLDDLVAVRQTSRLPLLRKDFLVDPYQVVEARAFGADAVLLIVAALAGGELEEMLEVVRAEGLCALVEVHTAAELEAAVAVGAEVIGINNRDLTTFETTTRVTYELLPRVSRPRLVVSESGLGEEGELARLESAGVDAFLIGEALMRAQSPGAALARLLSV